MLFSHDTELTLRAAAMLVNTDDDDGEQLGDQAALDEYLNYFGWTTPNWPRCRRCAPG
jgi:hypothetical protein